MDGTFFHIDNWRVGEEALCHEGMEYRLATSMINILSHDFIAPISVSSALTVPCALEVISPDVALKSWIHWRFAWTLEMSREILAVA